MEAYVACQNILESLAIYRSGQERFANHHKRSLSTWKEFSDGADTVDNNSTEPLSQETLNYVDNIRGMLKRKLVELGDLSCPGVERNGFDLLISNYSLFCIFFKSPHVMFFISALQDNLLSARSRSPNRMWCWSTWNLQVL